MKAKEIVTKASISLSAFARADGLDSNMRCKFSNKPFSRFSALFVIPRSERKSLSRRLMIHILTHINLNFFFLENS